MNLNFPVPIINHGPRAGQPREIVDVLLDRITAARDVLIRLRDAGYKPIRVDLDGPRPTVEVLPHPDLTTLAEEGVAGYYASRDTQRCGLWQFGGVRIIWNEEVPPCPV